MHGHCNLSSSLLFCYYLREMAIVVMMYLAEQTKHVGHAGLLSAPSFKLILGYDTILPADL
jgi:hypothetical protein